MEVIMKETFILNARIYANNAIIDNGFIHIKGSVIADVGNGSPLISDTAAEVIDVGGRSVIPGFIDLQVNGAGGYLLTDLNTSHYDNITRSLARYGTTSFLVATSPCSNEEHRDILNFVSNYLRNQISGSRVLGVHMEGPFLNPDKSGANDPSFVSSPNKELFESFLSNKDTVRIMTIAPETGDFSDIYELARTNGVVLSLGHSLASYDEAISAYNSGVKMVTHVFNTMNGINARKPGIVMSFIDSKNTYGSVICDGVHVHPSLLKLLYRNAGPDKLVLITDAAPTSATEEKEFDFDGMKIVVKGYTCYTNDGTIMGSSLTMNKAAKIAKEHMKCSTSDIVRMGSYNPSRIIGENHKGSISVGYDADLLVLQDEVEFDPYCVLVRGEIEYHI